GLNGLGLRTDSSVAELTDGINLLIQGAAIAFMTSVWGVFLSLVANFLRKGSERKSTQEVSKLQRTIDEIYKKHAPEQSLVKIMDASRSSADSLNVLHEKIGESMQTAIQSLSVDMQESLVSSINSAMAPAMEELRKNAGE